MKKLEVVVLELQSFMWTIDNLPKIFNVKRETSLLLTPEHPNAPNLTSPI